MRLREPGRPLDPGVERELDAVDRALAGRAVDPDLADWAELTALLSEERPEPAPGWSEEIDRRVAAGFRADGDGVWSSLADRLGGIRPMKLLAPAGALATAAVVVAVGVSSFSGGGDATELSSGREVTSALSAEEPPVGTGNDGETRGGQRMREFSLGSGDAGSAGGLADATEFSPAEAAPSSIEPLPPTSRSDDGRIAPGTQNRKVERDVTLALSTRPEDVRDTADEAIAITRSAGGIVATSQVTEAGRQAMATLELTIPTRNLDSVVDQLTELANVASLTELSDDITRPFVSAQDRLDDAEALRAELLEALGNADTAAEADALRLQIDDARREISRAEAAFDKVARQARLSDLRLTIQGDPNAKADDDGRTIGDWLDDTVSVLRDVAGILLVSAAILIPLGILVALTWFAVSALRRRRREHALD